MSEKVCPWWLGYFLASPIRKFVQDPQRILAPYIEEGDTALDVGSAMGFFSLPMARLVGERGHVVCVDLQERMIEGLKKRAKKAGLMERMEFRVCTQSTLQIDDLAAKVDFALAFAVVHEVPDAKRLFSEIRTSLKPGGLFLLSEPTGHVTERAFEETVLIVQAAGLRAVGSPKISRAHSRLLIND